MTVENADQERWMEMCGVLKRYRHPVLEKLGGGDEISAYCDRLKEHCEEGAGLLLIGGIGTGKTMGLAYIVSRARDELPSSAMTLMATADAICDRLYHKPENLAALASVKLLLIDDLGGDYRADWGFERLEALVEGRYSQQRATCVSTKLSLEELEAAPIMARIMSRWREVMEVVVLPGVDRRQTRAERRAELREAGYQC